MYCPQRAVTNDFDHSGCKSFSVVIDQLMKIIVIRFSLILHLVYNFYFICPRNKNALRFALEISKNENSK